MNSQLVRQRPPFTMIANGVIENDKIGKEALLVYVVLCYHADRAGRAFPSYTTIAREARISRRSAINAVSALVVAGILEKECINRPGTEAHQSNVYTIKDSLQGSAPPAPRSADDAPGGAPEHQEQESSNKTHRTKKKEYAENVSLTETEHTKLVERYGESGARACIDRLDAYKGANGKKYKSDYQAIRLWVAESLKLKPIQRPRVMKCGRCGAVMVGLTCDACGWSEGMA
jgi:hypothetical protein